MIDWTMLWEGFLDLLFPEPAGCHICGGEGDLICSACAAGLYVNGPAVCEVCGRTVSQGTRCSVCKETDFTRLCTGIRILYRYEDTARRAVHQAKFQGSRMAAKVIARKLADHILGMPEKPDVILFVPSHPLRTLLRGYSSMGYIAKTVSRMTGIPLEARALRRVRYAAPLYRASFQQRRQLVQGAFARGKTRRSWNHAVLLDDVCTSGSTLRECLRVLNDPQGIQAVIFAGHEDHPLEETKDL